MRNKFVLHRGKNAAIPLASIRNFLFAVALNGEQLNLFVCVRMGEKTCANDKFSSLSLGSVLLKHNEMAKHLLNKTMTIEWRNQ